MRRTKTIRGSLNTPPRYSFFFFNIFGDPPNNIQDLVAKSNKMLEFSISSCVGEVSLKEALVTEATRTIEGRKGDLVHEASDEESLVGKMNDALKSIVAVIVKRSPELADESVDDELGQVQKAEEPLFREAYVQKISKK